MNEFALIDRYFKRAPRDPAVALGVGDDAAVLRPETGRELVLTVDLLVEGRHFLPGTDPARLGHKVLAVNLSDLAAMGARPRWALLAGALPDSDEAWLAAFAAGLFALADAHGVELVGGDTTRGARAFALTLAGDVPAGTAITRAGARAGDDVWVSGTLGDAMLALAALEGRTTLPAPALDVARARLEAPTPRVALGAQLRGIATAAIDVSDGLTGDLGHILECSGVGARVELAALPRSSSLGEKLAGSEHELALQCLLGGGDDYELCFTAPAARRAEVAAIGRSQPVPLARVGAIIAGSALVVVDDAGIALPALPRAFDHFAR